jgi:hypothetical protein
MIAACGQSRQESVDTEASVDGTGDVAAATSAPNIASAPAAKPDAPLSISYRIVGAAAVGQPVTIELQVVSTSTPQPVQVSYRINDASMMRLADSQLPVETLSASAGDAVRLQQVRVVPLREGRVYLNVSASVATGEGNLSTVTAIPIQVGNGPRQLIENGVTGTDDDGAAIRVLPGSES